MNAAPRAGQAQSMIYVRSGPKRMFSGLKSVFSSASLSSRSRSASRSTYAAQRCQACSLAGTAFRSAVPRDHPTNPVVCPTETKG